MVDEYTVRPATPADAALIAHQRVAMFRDMGGITAEEAPILERECESWIADLFTRAGYAGWIVESAGQPVAGGGAVLRAIEPRPGYLQGTRGAHVVNVYTLPEHRRRGLAKLVMQTILAWCAGNGYQHVTLAASDEGRPLYEALGFVATNDMRLSRPIQ